MGTTPRAVLILLLAIVVTPAAFGQPGDAGEPGLSMQMLTVGKRVLPLYLSEARMWTTDLKPPDVVLRNALDEAIDLQELQLRGLVGGVEVVRYTAPQKDLEAFLEFLAPRLGGLLSTSEGRAQAALAFGEVVPLGALGSSAHLAPGEGVIVSLSRLWHVQYTGDAKLDGLSLVVSCATKDGAKIHEFPIELVAHQTETNHRFPLAQHGDLVIANLPSNRALHRRLHSQEFAMDIVAGWGAGDDEAKQSVEEYTVFDRDVIAVSDGEVVGVGKGFPDELMSNPAAFDEARFAEITEPLKPEIGFLNAVCGNYVVLDHGSGEFSLYAHLRQGSVPVEIGDTVAAGDVIGRVGNTGHSTEPHLHFQMMDGPDPLSANGLPVMFEDVPASAMSWSISEANSLFMSGTIHF